MFLTALLTFAVLAPADVVVSKITVVGNGRVETPPGLATLTYQVRGESSTSNAALKDLAGKATAIEGALHAIDPEIKVTDSGVTIRAIRGAACTEDDNENRLRLSQGPCAIVGYRAIQDFQVKTQRILDAGTMAGVAARQGAADPSVTDFNVLDLPAAKARAIAAAIADARGKAEILASGSRLALGSVIAVSLDGAQDSQDIIVTGRRLPSQSFAEREDEVAVVLKPRPVETRAEVTVSYAIR